MKLQFLLAGFLSFSSAYACVSPGLSDYLVYATEGITANASDYEGLVGSGGSVALTNFKVLGKAETCLAITSLGGVSVSDGSVDLGIETTGAVNLQRMRAASIVASNLRIAIRDASIDGKAYAPDLIKTNASTNGGYQRAYITMHANHAEIPSQMASLSEGWKITAPAGTKVSVSNGQKIVEVRDTVSVLNVDQTFFRSGSFTVIKGDSSKLLVVNVDGQLATLRDFHIYLEGMDPSQVLFNFHQAQSLTIRNTGNGVEGLPGSVLAPNAELNFAEGLITGQVLVKRINAPMKGERSGQVNRAFFFQQAGGKPEGKPGKH